MMMSRRDYLLQAAALASAAAAPPPEAEKLTICAFSKHFQWAQIGEMASTCAALGYEGIDLTLRSGGHIEPERVADELPRAVETIHKAGLTVPMVTAGIVDVMSPHAERIVRALRSAGIRRYRWGGFRYKESGALPPQVEEFRRRTADLAALNRQYGVCAMYHTHSGAGQVGASMWDLYLILKDFSPDEVAVNYDIGHATAEGGYGGWIHSSRLLLPHARGIAVKDFRWKQNAKGQWVPGWCALGEGMVDFGRFFGMMKASGFHGPLQLHMEYPELGGADTGKREFSISKEQLLKIMRRDLERLNLKLRETGVRA